MMVELFLHYIPFYFRWFPVFYKGTCGLAVTVQGIAVTSERFIVVWLPMKVGVFVLKSKTMVIS